MEVADDGASLLEVLRDGLGIRSAKDGCSPQGQCGCCTVLVDGQARVSCVTPARRVAGRRVTTLDGLAEEERQSWAEAFCATGGSQCGFCTPGIIMRLSALASRGTPPDDAAAVSKALGAHLCRCTGWQTIEEAFGRFGKTAEGASRDLPAASWRATIEGGAHQVVGAHVALGRAGFSDDTAPAGALVAVPDGSGGWSVGEDLQEARRLSGKVQGRHSTAAARAPLELPPGEWATTLRTSWIEPAYLETDASWCEPGGEPSTVLANGGAFGAKLDSPAPAAARELADRLGRPVRVVLSREDTTRLGPKRPPVAGGVDARGRGVLRVARTPGIDAVLERFAGDLRIEQVDVAGPPTSAALRAAGWAEAVALQAGARGSVGVVRAPGGGEAEVDLSDGSIHVRVSCGDPLDQVVLRSYCIGAVHMALSLVTSEGLTVDEGGRVQDLTVRSFGVLRAADMPVVEVEVEPSTSEPVNGSDAVFAATAAAIWIAQGCPPQWPSGVPPRATMGQ